MKLQLIGKTPCEYEPSAAKAPIERSREPDPHPGQLSTSKAVCERVSYMVRRGEGERNEKNSRIGDNGVD